MKRKHSDDDSGGDSGRPKNPNSNANAMFCNRRKRDKNRLTRWVEEIKLEINPRERLSKLKKKRERIESIWGTHYVSDNPRFKNSSPRIAWWDLWKKMDELIAEAEIEIRTIVANDKRHSSNMFANVTGGNPLQSALGGMNNTIPSRTLLNNTEMATVSNHEKLSNLVVEYRRMENAIAKFNERSNSQQRMDMTKATSAAFDSNNNFNGVLSRSFMDRANAAHLTLNGQMRYSRDSSANGYSAHLFKEGNRSPVPMNRLQQAPGGEMLLSEPVKKEGLAIPSDELKQVHIAVLQEKVSNLEKKLVSVQKAPSESRLQDDVYVKTIMKLEQTNEVLTVKNKELEEELAGRLVRERKLQEVLAIYEQKTKLLADELKATQTAFRNFSDPHQKGSVAVPEAGKSNSSISGLEEKDKRLETEENTPKASAEETENDDRYLLI